MKHARHLLFILVCALALVGCKKSHKARFAPSEFPANAQPTNVRIVAPTNAANCTPDCFVAKVNCTATDGHNQRSIGGSLRIKRGEAIQLLITPLGLMEAARLELTPEGMLFVDRMNHIYVRAPYTELSLINLEGMDYYSFEALFRNELFLLGKEDRHPVEKDYMTASQDNNILLLDRNTDRAKLQFVVPQNEARVAHTRITDAHNDGRHIDWVYTNFQSFDFGIFPSQIDLHATNGDKQLSAQLVIRSIRENADWDAFTVLSDRYTPLSFPAVRNQLLKMLE